MSAVATITSLIPLFVVAAMRRAEARIHRQLTDARAFDAESSIQLSLKRSMDRRRLEGLIHGGAVRLTSNSLYFLDAEGWENYQRNRRRRVLFALSVVLSLVAVGLTVVWILL